MRQVVNVMQITLYQTNSEAARANKNISSIDTVNAVPTDDLDILAPVVVLDYNTAYLATNYIYIDLFKRFYFITDRAVTIGKRIVITCAVDALMSWVPYMGNNDITVTRSQAAGITKMPDNKLPIIPCEKEITSTVLRSNFFTKTDTNSYLLSVIGGDNT